MKSLALLPVVVLAATLPFPRPVDTALPRGDHDWAVDAVHSSVVFRVKHANASYFKGSFDHVEGKLTLDPAAPAKGSVELKIAVDSIDTNDAKRDGHLKGADFFSAKENPEITFKSTKIEGKGDTLQVTGDLTMCGKTNSVTVPVTKVGEGEFHGKRVGYSATFMVQRSKFGMTYGLEGGVLGDDVTLMIDLELTQQ